MTLCPQDFETIATWVGLGGVPDDRGTREVACRMLLQLWAKHLEVEAALAEVLELHAEDLQAAAEMAREYEACQRIAYAMAGAIGWETPGESWVDKAANWRQDPESLPGLYLELHILRRIARALVALNPDHLDHTGACVLCDEGPGDYDHADDCPWAVAQSWRADHEPARVDDRKPTICLSCNEAIPAAEYVEHRRHCQDDIAETNERPAEEKLTDLMAALATSVDEAKAARAALAESEADHG